MIHIRLADVKDADAILAIYTPYIMTPITFETEVPELDEFKQRIQSFSEFYPYLLCTINDFAVGYAYAHAQMERAAYQWNAELSVYVSQGWTGCGIGMALYTAMLEILHLQGIQNVYGGVTTPNASSEGLHRRLGFKVLGTYAQTGYKSGKWHDVTWFEKSIGEHQINPLQPLSIQRIEMRIVSEILSNCEKMVRYKQEKI